MQTSEFTSTKDLKEITLHFELQQRDKHGGDQQLIYCQLKISSEAIKLLIATKGAIPKSYMHALKDVMKLTHENQELSKITKDYTQVKKLIEESKETKKIAEELQKVVEDQKKEIARL